MNKIQNDVLEKIKDKGEFIYKEELIKKLCPPYSRQEIGEALDYLSHSHHSNDGSKSIPARIEIHEAEESRNGEVTLKDKMIWIIK